MRIYVIVALAGIAVVAHAQSPTSGGIKGRVVDDQTHEPLPGVTVTATSPALLQPQSAITDETGTYVISDLPPGAPR